MTNLRRLAEAATPGPWMDYHDAILAGIDKSMGESWTIAYGIDVAADAAYIAACDPQTILALLDVADAADRLTHSHGSGAYVAAFDDVRAAVARLDEVAK